MESKKVPSFDPLPFSSSEFSNSKVTKNYVLLLMKSLRSSKKLIKNKNKSFFPDIIIDII